jgi:hypothetical protein
LAASAGHMIRLLLRVAPLALRHRVIAPSMSCGIAAYRRRTSLQPCGMNVNIRWVNKRAARAVPETPRDGHVPWIQRDHALLPTTALMMWWAARTFTSLRGCIVFRTEAIRAASVGTSTMFRPQPGFSCRVSRIRRGRLDRPPTFTSSNGSSGLVLRKPLCEARSNSPSPST